ncbi:MULTISPECIES: SusC/RagA family TonB-linked outer membrane protein [Flammeovirga]|uniref:TonB-dependent receptor n=1 Tax=Flammeovirga agarivorans TaxID=2726742 RepID=A0A7X8SK08_9BACT|nr:MULTISPECIES: TonB-dependent receptor [Flammeovirga]NLR91649.1 TonB-dependent receptor [Flammeovirga agarivorans]
MNKINKLITLILGGLLMLSMDAYAQKEFIKVKGIVIGEDDETIPGVSIRIKGTNNGTATDFDGNYSLRVKQNAVLMVSYVGYTQQEIPVNGRSIIDIQLIPEVEELDELVVVGYGKQDAKEVSGSIQSMVMDDEVNSMPAASFDQMLQGRMAGVQVSAGEGGPGEAMNFEIRGANTITGSSAPLYVVDGFPLEDPSLFTLDPADIERIDVLKDASATAIYGSRGSNGVILVTTKQGLAGKPVITFNTKVGVSQIPHNRRMETLNAHEYVQLQHDLGGGDPWGDVGNYTDADMTNWQDEIFKVAPFQNYNVSMRGGSDQTKYFGSMGYVNQAGTLMNTGFERINGRFKLDQNLGKRVNMSMNINYSHTEHKGQKTSTASVSAIKSAIMFRPMTPKNGDLDDDDELSAGFYPPTQTLENTDRSEISDVMQANVNFDVDLAKGLKFRTQLGYQINYSQTKTFFREGTNQADRGSDGINGHISQLRAQNFINENTLSYDWSKNGHKIDALAGITFQSTNRYRFQAAAIQFPLDDLGWNNIGLGNVAKMPTSAATGQNLMSGLSRVNYAYKGKYILTASLRADGSSRFKQGNRFGIFPSVSAAWRAGDEDFIQNLNVFSDLKFKTGIGTTGNNRVGDFDFIPTMAVGPGYYLGGQYQSAFYQDKLANTNLKWETTQQFNIGAEMGFLNNRLLVDVEYYYNLTDNLLFDAKVAPSTGYTQVKQNIGAVANRGLEFSVNTVNVQTKNFKWTSNFNISFNDNEIKNLSYGEDFRLYDPNVGGMFAGELYYGLFVGMPMTQMYGYRYDGVYQKDDFVRNSNGELVLREGVPGFNSQTGQVRPGMPKYRDVNGDGVIDENDKEIIGNPNPRHFGGFTNNFTYKNWDLSILLTWSVGQEVFNGNMADFGVVGNQRGRNYLKDVGNRWALNNPVDGGVWGAPGPGQDYTYQQVYGGHQMSDYFIEDASFLRIKNVTVGYTFEPSKLKKLRIERMRVYGSVDNLWVFTNYSGYDPEVSVRNQAMYKGIDYSSYPASQSFIVGFQVSF